MTNKIKCSIPVSAKWVDSKKCEKNWHKRKSQIKMGNPKRHTLVSRSKSVNLRPVCTLVAEWQRLCLTVFVEWRKLCTVVFAELHFALCRLFAEWHSGLAVFAEWQRLCLAEWHSGTVVFAEWLWRLCTVAKIQVSISCFLCSWSPKLPPGENIYLFVF